MTTRRWYDEYRLIQQNQQAILKEMDHDRLVREALAAQPKRPRSLLQRGMCCGLRWTGGMLIRLGSMLQRNFAASG